MSKLSKSPDKGSFNIDCVNKALKEGQKSPQDAKKLIELYESWNEQTLQREQDTEWQKNNLEYDLRSCDWICEKVRNSERYSQNLYAAMCNMDWQKLAVIPILKEDTWSCSWRYAGGIVADMRQEGDYIVWYCSGIRSTDYEEEINEKWDQRKYVAEGTVTDEVREDLKKLGWIPVD